MSYGGLMYEYRKCLCLCSLFIETSQKCLDLTIFWLSEVISTFLLLSLRKLFIAIKLQFKNLPLFSILHSSTFLFGCNFHQYSLKKTKLTLVISSAFTFGCICKKLQMQLVALNQQSKFMHHLAYSKLYFFKWKLNIIEFWDYIKKRYIYIAHNLQISVWCQKNYVSDILLEICTSYTRTIVKCK